ncbi:unnamed protein product [Schistosoma margrebowiei]|uniref:Uncharacterized protein n=1 Tax=Schistosoma margrebowiei TaxID=48269 RepID=A0A183MDR9_9TREM|nr:unnamed protein product [Schistosoma margrebowiei]
MVGRYYFVICGPHDEALFDLDYNSPGKSTGEKADECLHLNQFIAHAALDMVDDHLWSKADTYLKVVDKFNEWLVSAFITPGISLKLNETIIYGRLLKNAKITLKIFIYPLGLQHIVAN